MKSGSSPPDHSVMMSSNLRTLTQLVAEVVPIVTPIFSATNVTGLPEGESLSLSVFNWERLFQRVSLNSYPREGFSRRTEELQQRADTPAPLSPVMTH
ncbi:hypothetical protein SRHO_G00116770 [Serrasalmus rhombeus]